MNMGYRVVAASWWIQDAEARLFDVYGIQDAYMRLSGTVSIEHHYYF